MLKSNTLFLVLLFFSISTYAQHVEMPKDSVCANSKLVFTVDTTLFTQDKITDPNITVTFAKGEGKYALDLGQEAWYQTALLIKSYYPTLSKDYVVTTKLVPPGEHDVVEATISGKNIDLTKIKFTLTDGTGVAAQEKEGKFILTLPGVKAGETYDVFALYEKKKGKYETAGKLRVVSYPKKEFTVTLVPVNGIMPNLPTTEAGLNKIYNPYGVTIRLKIDNAINGNMEWDTDDDWALNLNGSGFFSKESGEMKNLRLLYQRTSQEYDKNRYYLFVLDVAKADGEPDSDLVVLGDMPRSKQFGYIFTDKITDMPRLIAHELGHGIFTLLHTFDVNYAGDRSKTTTTNLMDYSSGSELAAFQWNVMSNPAPITWFDSEEEEKAITRRSSSNTIPYIATKIRSRDTVFYHSEETIYLLKQKSGYSFFNILNQKVNTGQDTVVVDVQLETIQWNFNGIVTNNKQLTIQTSELAVGQTYKLRVSIPKQTGYLPAQIGTISVEPISLEYTIVIIDNPIIEFVRNQSYVGEYGFDNDFWSCKTLNCYENTKINNIDYKIPWLSMQKNQKTNLQALIKLSPEQHNTLKKSKGEFKLYGKGIKFEGEKDTLVIDVNQLKSGVNPIPLEMSSSQETQSGFKSPEKLYAKLGEEVVGVLNFFCQDSRNFNILDLTIVPIYINPNSSGTNIDINKIKEEFNNKSFNQAFVECSITMLNTIKISWDSDSLILKEMQQNVYDQGWRNNTKRDYLDIITDIKYKRFDTVYKSDVIQQFLNVFFIKKYDALVSELLVSSGKYVMFVTDVQQDGKENGIATMKGKFSVIFRNGINDITTYIHELGHNLGLSHTFENTGEASERGIPTGSSEHYMDYSDSQNTFWKTDWEFIYNQALTP